MYILEHIFMYENETPVPTIEVITPTPELTDTPNPQETQEIVGTPYCYDESLMTINDSIERISGIMIVSTIAIMLAIFSARWIK